MKTTKLTKAILLGVAVCLTTNVMFAQNVLWSKRFVSANGSDWANAMTVDAQNNVYVAGLIWGPGLQADDMAVLKYDSAGTLLWSQTIDGAITADLDVAHAIAVDASGNVYITGELAQNSTQVMDMATIKYNSAGVQQWIKYYGGTTAGSERGRSIVTDGNNVYVSGSAYNDLKVVQYKCSSGTQGWVYTHNGSGNALDEAYDLVLDAANQRLFVCGQSAGSGQGMNAITASIDTATGNQNWLNLYNGASNLNDEAYDISLQINGGKLGMCGYTRNANNRDGLIRTYAASTGQVLYTTTYNGTNNLDDEFKSVFMEYTVVTATESVYVTGYTAIAGNPNFDKDMITRKYNIGLSLLWSVTKDGSQAAPEGSSMIADVDAGISITYSPWTDKIYVAGTIVQTNQQTNYITLRYNKSTGVQEWSAMYNHASFEDVVFTKYDLVISRQVCTNSDFIHVAGGSESNGNATMDIATVKYGSVCCPSCQGPEGRFAHNDEEGNAPVVAGILYPSPFNRQAALKIYYEDDIKEMQFVIYDMMGNEAARITNFTGDEIIIDRGNLRSGIYVYKLIINNEHMLSDKFIITD